MREVPEVERWQRSCAVVDCLAAVRSAATSTVAAYSLSLGEAIRVRFFYNSVVEGEWTSHFGGEMTLVTFSSGVVPLLAHATADPSHQH